MLRTPKVYRFGPFHLDVVQKDVLLRSPSAPVGLTDKEFDVIHAVVSELYKNAIDKVPNEKVFSVAWPGEQIPANNNRLSVHIGRINAKLKLIGIV
jgi:DNA-binding response OmpR family regulator